MGSTDKRIDAYIANAKPFAQPILNHFRALVHQACPDVEETMKWSFPHFDYKGEMMCSMASFKQHCAISFWKASLMKDASLIRNAKSESAMGHFGRIESKDSLPPDKKILGYIKEAMKLNDAGMKVPQKRKTTEKKELLVPDYLTKAIRKNTKAQKVWDGFAYSHKKEYVQWIIEAKTEETREKRIAQTLEWIAEGKQRNWKYMKK